MKEQPDHVTSVTEALNIWPSKQRMKTKPWNETIVIGDFSYADREIDNLICQVSRPVQNDWGFRKFLVFVLKIFYPQ